MIKLVASIRVPKAQYEAQHGRITDQELADKVGVSRHTISRWKNGKFQEINLDTLQTLCQVLKCRPEDIIKVVEILDQ